MDALLPMPRDSGAEISPFETADEPTQHYRAREKAENTLRSYRSDARVFDAWCSARSVASLPATPEKVAAFLASQADAGLSASTIDRRAAAIRFAHKRIGHLNPVDAEIVRSTMRGIHRVIGTAKVGKAPATSDVVAAMLNVCGSDIRGVRNRALLLTGFAAALRRSELVAIDVEHLTEMAEGYRILIPRSKGDQEGKRRRSGDPTRIITEACCSVEELVAARRHQRRAGIPPSSQRRACSRRATN